MDQLLGPKIAISTTDVPHSNNVDPHSFKEFTSDHVAPIEADCTYLLPPGRMKMSDRMRQLLGRSSFLTANEQIAESDLIEHFSFEFRSASTLQASLIKQLSCVIIEKRQIEKTVQTAIAFRKPEAARDVLCPGWTNFRPLHPKMTVNADTVTTAYDQFRAWGGDEVGALTDEEAICKATAKLAAMGLEADALLGLARCLALPTIERFEKIIASKATEQEGLVDKLFYLMDRNVRARETRRIQALELKAQQ